MTNTIHLQGIGKVNAIPAKELKVGDVTIWNHGGRETIISVEPSKTGKTLKVGIEYNSIFDGVLKQSERKLGADRLVGIATRK